MLICEITIEMISGRINEKREKLVNIIFSCNCFDHGSHAVDFFQRQLAFHHNIPNFAALSFKRKSDF